MNYEIRHFDTPLIRFSATEDSSRPKIKILWTDESKKYLFPLSLICSEDGIASWIKHRIIPRNRAYADSFLSKCGLNLNRPMSIIRVSRGVSLNDCYWITEEFSDESYDKCNLYDNRFSQILARIAFTGYGSSVRSSLASCPEFTTNGMLPKCWRREQKKIVLYKGGTTGASNTGNEPYSEFYASQIAMAMGISAINYNLSRWKGELCSTCNLFTDKDYSFIPVGRLPQINDFESAKNYYFSLGKEFEVAFSDMIIFDAVVANTDRHLGNFGFLIDNKSNTISKPAPIFDNGNSLFSLAGLDSFRDEASLCEYADTLLPCLYDNFIETAKSMMTLKHKEALRKLLNFRFKKHSRYNLPDKRLRLIEKQIQRRARQLLE